MHSVYILNLIFWIFVLIGWRAEYQASFEKVMITLDTERNNVAFWPIFCNGVFRTGNALIGMTVVIALRLLSLQTPRVYSYIISILRKWRYTKFIKAQASWNHWWTATKSKSFWWREATTRSWSKNQFFLLCLANSKLTRLRMWGRKSCAAFCKIQWPWCSGMFGIIHFAATQNFPKN